MTPQEARELEDQARWDALDEKATIYYETHRWMTKLAADLGKPDSTVYRWKAKPQTVPTEVLLLVSVWADDANVAMSAARAFDAAAESLSRAAKEMGRVAKLAPKVDWTRGRSA